MANHQVVASTEDSSSLHLLVLEDSEQDFQLTVRALEGASPKVVAVHAVTKEQFENLAGAKTYSAILSDYNIRGWNGMEALAYLRRQGIETPFILVSAELGEERAMQCVRQGAADCILKSRLNTLSAALCKAVLDQKLHEAKVRTEGLLHESEERFRALVDSIASAVLIYQGTECRYANRAAQELTGYSEIELMELSSWDLFHPDSRSSVIERGLSRLNDSKCATRYEAKILTKSGEVRVWDISLGKIDMRGRPAGLITASDVTDWNALQPSHQSSTSDSLTGLLNSIQVQSIFIGESRRSRRTGREFALLVLKLDELKQIKERSGPVECSRTLCQLAKALGEVCRGADSPARISEDEFAVVLPETSEPGVRRLAQRLSAQLNAEENQASLAISAGFAILPEDGPTVDHALRAARKSFARLETDKSITSSLALAAGAKK